MALLSIKGENYDNARTFLDTILKIDPNNESAVEYGKEFETKVVEEEPQTTEPEKKDKKKKEKKKKTFSAQTYFYETVDCLFYPFLSRVDLLFMPFQGDSLPAVAAGVRSACIYAAREDGRRR